MELDFISLNEKYEIYEEKFMFLMDLTIKHLKLNFSPIVSISIIDNEKIHEINKEYRHIDRETDVISFAFLDNDPSREDLLKSGTVVPLGDIYISSEKAISQAEEYGHTLEREFSFLFVHGLLHLLGYDHMNEDDEKIMFSLQEEILNKAGITR